MIRRWVFIVALIAVSCAKKNAEIWYCPMHHDYQSEHEGTCPICGMKLVKKDAATALPVKSAHSNETHDRDRTESINSKTHAPDTARDSFTIPAAKQHLLEIKTAKGEIRRLALTLHLPAQVAYEPDIYTALVEYRQLVGQAGSMPEGISGAALVSAARLRVRQLGLGDQEIQQFARSQVALSRLLTGNAGGQTLVSLQVPEGEIGMVRTGLPISVTASAFADKIFRGRITGIGTLVDARRRVFTVRALVKDTGGLLKAQMFVNADVLLEAGKGLSLPRSAIFDTGKRLVVFVKRDANNFTPVEVKILGGNDDYAIVSGIAASDEIVVSSAFLLDSEARLKIEDYR